jgi:signal transduction histidine kinase
MATDVLLYATTRDAVLLARIETAIDWGFVAFASVLLYIVAHRAAARLSRAQLVLSTVVESIGDGLLVVGADRTIVYANPAACQMLASRPEEIVGMTAQQFSQRFVVSYPNGALVPPQEFIAQRAFDTVGPLHYTTRLHPSTDNELVLASSAAGVRPRQGRPAAFVVSILHDVTDSEHLEQLRDRFFAGAAHSLKTPVAIIKANVQYIARTAEATFQPSFKAIERQCDRIDRIVQNLLVVSRARSHSLELRLAPLELATVVVDTVRALNIASHAHAIHTEILATPRVQGDRERLATVVRNLIFESIHVAKPGAPLTLRVSLVDGAAELAVYYEALPVAERTFAGAAQYDDATLSRCATETIVDAHAGKVGEEVADPLQVVWVRLPTIGEQDQ